MFKQNLCFERKKMVNFLTLAKIYVKFAVLPLFYHKKTPCPRKDKGAFFHTILYIFTQPYFWPISELPFHSKNRVFPQLPKLRATQPKPVRRSPAELPRR